jgi:hypothetical protein
MYKFHTSLAGWTPVKFIRLRRIATQSGNFKSETGIPVLEMSSDGTDDMEEYSAGMAKRRRIIFDASAVTNNGGAVDIDRDPLLTAVAYGVSHQHANSFMVPTQLPADVDGGVDSPMRGILPSLPAPEVLPPTVTTGNAVIAGSDEPLINSGSSAGGEAIAGAVSVNVSISEWQKELKERGKLFRNRKIASVPDATFLNDCAVCMGAKGVQYPFRDKEN